MAILNGVLLPSVDGWVTNKNGMVTNLSDYYLARPFVETVIDTAPLVLATSKAFNLPNEDSYSINAMHVYSPFDDIYNRFYFVPESLSFGSITGDTKRELLIWNAYILPKQVLSFSESGYFNNDGVFNNFDQAAYPMDFFGLEVKSFEVNVTLEGNPEFDITYSVSTTDGSIDIGVTGFRTVLFSLSPHKSFTHSYIFESRVTESYETEQRAALTTGFIEKFSYQARSSQYERAYFRQLFNSGTSTRFSIPVWEDYLSVEQVLSGLGHIDVGVGRLENLSYYIGGTILLWSGNYDYEQARVLDIDFETGRIYTENPIRNNRQDFFLMPIRGGVHDDSITLDFRGVNSHVFDCNFRLLDQLDTPIVQGGLTYLAGKPFIDEPNYQDSGKEDFGFELDTFKGVGGNTKITHKKGFSIETKSFVWKCFSREEYFKLKEFIFATRGKWKSFWLPRFGKEFRLSEPTNISDSQFTVDTSPYVYEGDDLVGCALYLQDKSGNKYQGVINTVTRNGTTLSISCNEVIDFVASDSTLLHCCIADLVRSTTDEIEVEFEDVHEISCKISARKIKE